MVSAVRDREGGRYPGGMGFIRNAKADAAMAAAEKAHATGQAYYTVQFPGSMGDWPALIEAVESAGWTLQHWAAVTNVGNPIAVPLFVRKSDSTA